MNKINSLHSRTFYAILLTGIFAALGIWQINTGSLFNSDDSLYAIISRHVARGDIYPLKYLENSYHAKPPLFFWIDGLFIHILGEKDWIVRIPNLLAMTLSVGLCIFALIRKNLAAAVLFFLLVLGSPGLFFLARRVLIEPWLILWSVVFFLCILWGVQEKKTHAWLYSLICILLGWFTKTLAIIPALLAALVFIERSSEVWNFKKRASYYAGMLLAGVLFFILLRSGNAGVVPGINLFTQNDFLVIPHAWELWFEVLRIESYLFWVLPFWAVVQTLRWRKLEPLEQLFLLALISYTVIPFLSGLPLPHYFYPSLFFYSVSLGYAITKLHRFLRITMLSIALWFSFSLQKSRLDPNLFEVHPADSIAEAAKTLQPELLPEQALCVVDVHPVGFVYYFDRPVHAFFSKKGVYETSRGIAELQGYVHWIEDLKDKLYDPKICNHQLITPQNRAVELLRSQNPRTERTIGTLHLFSW